MKLIDGKAVSAKVRQEIKSEVQQLKDKGITPGLAVVIVGQDPASRVYVNNKKKACLELGMHSEEYALPEETSQEELLQKAVIVLDVNNLKQINDNLGHKAGDELICGAASCIRYAFSKYGKCFRTGGDEFIVFISKDYDSQERLLQYFDRITSAWHGTTVQTLSISYGFLAVTDDLPITELIQKADALMYENKREYHRHLADR